MSGAVLRAAALAAALVLGGCGGIGVAGWAAIGGAVGGTAVSAIHDCKQDGGCKAVPLPP